MFRALVRIGKAKTNLQSPVVSYEPDFVAEAKETELTTDITRMPKTMPKLTLVPQEAYCYVGKLSAM